jgi:hypothetical protein
VRRAAGPHRPLSNAAPLGLAWNTSLEHQPNLCGSVRDGAPCRPTGAAIRRRAPPWGPIWGFGRHALDIGLEPEREAEQRGPGVERKRRKIDLCRWLIGWRCEHLLDAGDTLEQRPYGWIAGDGHAGTARDQPRNVTGEQCRRRDPARRGPGCLFPPPIGRDATCDDAAPRGSPTWRIRTNPAFRREPRRAQNPHGNHRTAVAPSPD